MNDSTNSNTNSDQTHQQNLLIFEESASSSASEIERRKKRKVTYIPCSDSGSDSDNSVICSKRRSLIKLIRDSSDSSDSEVIRNSKKIIKIITDSSNDESSDTEFENDLQADTQPTSSKVLEDNGSSSDSSDGQSEKCPICLISFKNQEVGSPEACDHSFCADCILEWAKTVNTCPIDRKTFKLVLIRNSYNGRYIRTVTIEQPSDNVLDRYYVGDDDATPCEICGSSLHEERLLLCDGCDLAYHLDCLEPPLASVPEGEWFCPSCSEIVVDVNVEVPQRTIENYQRSYATPRLVPRTRQTERIRTRIVNQRGQNNDVDLNDPPSTAGRAGPSTSNRTTRKKTVKKRKRKYKRKPRYRIIYEIDEATGEKIIIKKKTRRYKKRKTKKRIPVRRVIVPKSVKNRLARQLGICPPQTAGQSLPDMKVQINPENIGQRRSQAGIPTLHLFGQRDQLDYFSESDSEIEGHGVNILVGRRPNLRDSAVQRRIARNKATALNLPSSTTSSVDVLGSILDTQRKFHSKNSIISIGRDGSLKIDVNEKQSFNNDKYINLANGSFRVRQTPMESNNTNRGSPNTSSNNQYRDQTDYTNFESVPTSTVGNSDLGNTNNYQNNQEEDGPQDYSLNRHYNDYEPKELQDKKKKTNDSNTESLPDNTGVANSDSDLDIYSDIETVSTSKLEDSEIRYASSAPLQIGDDDNDSDTDLVIDTEKSDPEKYDPEAAFESDNDTIDEPVTSTSESVTVTKHSDFVSAVWNSEIQSETVQSSNQNEFQQSSLLTENVNDCEKQLDEDIEEPEDDCPNSNIYSSESLNLAKSTELNILISNTNVQSNTSDNVITLPTSFKDDSGMTNTTRTNIPQETKRIYSGLYSDSEDETIIKINPQKPFGIGDLRNITEDISEEERSYTPCLDEKEPGCSDGIIGLDTEMISDDDKNDFEESHELKTTSDGDALEINAKESELDFTRPEECEEGEIIERLKSKQTEDIPMENNNLNEDNIQVSQHLDNDKSKEEEMVNREPVFKKLSKSNKERNYRDKENKERNKSKEVKNYSQKNKRKDKREELPRYDVRSIVETKPKYDKFGRDPTFRPSYSSSKSVTPPRRFGRDVTQRRSSSCSSKSVSPRRFGRTEIRRDTVSFSSRSPTPPNRRSPSRTRKSKSPNKIRKRKEKSRSRSKSRGRRRRRSKSNHRKRKSFSRDRRKSRRKLYDRSKRKRRQQNYHSKSPSRNHDFGRRHSRGWSPSISCSRSPEMRHLTPSWTPPHLMNQSVRPQNLTVILPNVNNKKRKERRRKLEKKGKDNDKQKKRRHNDISPPPSKEVFASGNNILVSVSFNKDNEERNDRSKRRRDNTGEELTTKRIRKEKEKQNKTSKGKRRLRNITNLKPVAIIDLDRSPFKELTPSPKDVIILSDSENADSNDIGLEKTLSCNTSQQAASPELPVNNTNYMNSMGPKTPPEPQIKFTFNAKPQQLRSISNPLHEPDDVDEEIDPQEELENRLNEVIHKGPNTPPEPPNSPPSSPDAYDPFDPTKSRSPTPEPKQVNSQPTVNQCIEDTQEELPDHSIIVDISEKNGTPVIQSTAIKSLTPPIPISDMQPADSQSSVRVITPDTNLDSSPERPIGVIINQQVQSQNSVFPTPKSVVSLGSTSLITSTPASSNLNVPRINILSSSIITAPTVTSSIHQRIVLPNTTKLSPINKVSPSKAPIKPTPIKPMVSKNSKQPSNSKSNWKSKNHNIENNDANLDFDSPYSPGSSDYDDLFDPPTDVVKSKNITKSAQATKNTKSPSKQQSTFDLLFGSSPVHANKNKNKTKPKTKKTQQTSKGTTKQVGVKLDEDNLKILDELPNSAVEMQVKDKFLKKLNRQERVVEEVKFVLKPYYNKKRVTKEEYKDILRRAVPKICHNKSGEINPKKIQHLIEAYVKRVKHNKKVTSSSSVNPQKTEVISNWLSKLG